MADIEIDVLSEIRRILVEQLGWRGPVTPSQHLVRDLELDSLGITVLVVELENRFRVLLPPESGVGVSTVGDLARLLAARLAAEGRAS